MALVITGASRGIGAGLAEVYRARGDQVIGTTRNGDWPLDVTDPASHSALAAQLRGQPVSLLVCNAGVYVDKGATLPCGFASDLWAQTFAANVTGVFLTIQSLLPNLTAASNPRIAILSSKMGSQALAPGGSYIYRASKAAVLNVGRNLAADLRPQGIAVGIYHPGWVQTDMGGADADVTIEASVAGLADRFDALTLETSGVFEDWNGAALPF